MDTVLFDLDGTLLPMDTSAFMKIYFSELAKKCAGFGFDPATVPNAVWAGTKQMVGNDGSASNEARFWDEFAKQMGSEAMQLKPELELFYANEFHRVKAATQQNPAAAQLIKHLKSEGYTIVLASNPLFPLCAYATRLSWLGLGLEDFHLVTDYQRFHYCKPNPSYYSEILQIIGKEPRDCIMVGNDVHEDGAAAEIGISVYITTDNLIEDENIKQGGHQRGSFAQMAAWLPGRLKES